MQGDGTSRDEGIRMGSHPDVMQRMCQASGPQNISTIIIGAQALSSLSLLLRFLYRFGRSCCSTITFLLKDIAPRIPVFTLPAATTLDIPQCSRVTVARVRLGREFEAPLHL